MAKERRKIQFQFDDQLDYQLDAINSVVRLFDGLPKKIRGLYEPASYIKGLAEGDPVSNAEISSGSRMLENLRTVQLDNGLYADKALYDNNFTIEMETGTGKTYVYLRTILELYQKYGFKKFMIVVPSIPIRLGVEKSIQQLKEHFKAIYNMDLTKHSFIYDSKNPNRIISSFVEAKDLSLCILNIQAFNKDSNKIRAEDEYGRVLWADIKQIRPIVIIDEPQKIEGAKSKKSKSLQAIEDINPLFTLRYSATHKKLYNQIYKLNSYDAYKKELVKQIQVKTINGVIPKDFPYVRYLDFTKDLYARIEMFSQKQGRGIRFETFKVRGNASLFDLSGDLPQYADYRIAEDPHKLKPLKVSAGNETIELASGHSTYEITENEAVRIQIRLAIENHFKKQTEILRKGRKIKVLTLFFVDNVSKVRDNTRSDGRGDYLRIFDEEYERAVKGENGKKMVENLKEALNSFAGPDEIFKVREGYFAVDKYKNAVEVEGWDSSLPEEELKIKTKSQEDIDRGIELILRKKDELISFDEPLAFIFSHSALREGWDNPNIFTICTLKNAGSDIAKKQEIGRGLRLPVDINGVRCTDSAINELTIIANDNFAHFADRLQKDFNDAMNFKKDEVTPDILAVTLKKAGVPIDKINAKLVDKLREELFFAGIINSKNMLTGKANQINGNILFTDATLKEHCIMIMKAFKESMVEKGSSKIHIRNGDNEPMENSRRSYCCEESFFKIFKSLAEQLSKRTIYRLNLDKEKFIDECINEINALLLYRKVQNQYEIKGAEVEADGTGRIVISGRETKVLNRYEERPIIPKSDFELANRIMYHTNLPRFAIFRILQKIEKKLLLSNQDILDTVIRCIHYKLNEAKAEAIYSYEIIKGYEFDDKVIFEADTIDEEMLKKEKKVYETKESEGRGIYQYYKADSEGEYDFAKSLDEDPNVVLFTKIKKGGFVIDTPYGNYSPDWAIVYKEGEGNTKLYFITETKFEKEWKDLTDVEKLKIKCGTLHFKAVSEATKDRVCFNWANSYENFKEKIGIE
ncbi:MAG: restriction endonuclease subunit R [Lachnospiraceae bacterium]|nr:restriction endonuclease subunit R [Lachnospiraceae bacterium]